MIIFLYLFLGVITLLLYLMMRRFKYWERKNVPTGKVIPFFGDNYDICMGDSSSGELLLTMHNKVPPHHRYVGAYFFHVPVLVLRTPEIIRQICIKDFDHFVDHGSCIINSADDMWAKALFPLKGQDWKDTRALLSPILNGNKVKLLFPVIDRHSKNFVSFIREKEEEVTEVDIRDCILRILNDICSDAALGMEVDSFRDPNNIVLDIGLKTCDLSRPYKKIVLLLYTLCQTIPKIFGMSLFGEGQEFFENVVRDTLKLRQANGTKRADMMGLLMEHREELKRARAQPGAEGKKFRDVSDQEMTSFVFIMYFGVIDSVTTNLAFLAWELAMAPEIQERLWQECNNTPSGGGEATYQDIIDMKYMDMVMSEVLRKWPGVIATDRICVKPYTIQPELPHEKPVHLEVGDNILIPIYSIHRDPKNFEDPEKFDPERFSPENKNKTANAYIPFGAGPRYCVSTRFSNILMKLIFYRMIRAFEFVPVEKTQRTLVMDKEGLSLYPVGGFPLGLKRRN